MTRMVRLASLSGLVAVGVVVMETRSGGPPNDSALKFVRDQEPPQFAKDHRLPPLTLWRTMSYDVMREVAEHWGYGMLLYATPGTVDQLADPTSVPARIARLVASDPNRYRLAVRVAPEVEFRSGRLRLEDFPDDAFYRDETGAFVDGERQFSPLASPEAMDRIGEYLAEQVRAIRAVAPIAMIVNGGEYGFEKPQRVPLEVALRDPHVRAALERDGREWVEFMSDQKARHERIIREAVLAAAPEALYIHYSEVGGGHPRRMMAPEWERLDFLYRPGVSDLAGSRHYYRHGNTGFTKPKDILSQLLNSRAQEIDAGASYAYFWLSAGWSSRGRYADPERYEGFLKMAYTSGSLGAIAGYFGGRPDQDPVAESMPQFVSLGRVHAMFSHVDDILLDGDLLPGPDHHRWSHDLPAYEFPTGDPDARVLVRRHRTRPLWLVTAWAARGEARTVAVEVRGLGPLRVQATPRGTVYLIEHELDGRMTQRSLDT